MSEKSGFWGDDSLRSVSRIVAIGGGVATGCPAATDRDERKRNAKIGEETRSPAPNSMPFPKVLHSFSPERWLVPIVLFAILTFGALPNYIQGHWWSVPPPVTQLKQLKELAKTGVTLAGWKTASQKTVELASGKWVMQTLEADGTEPIDERQRQVILLLRPQTSTTGSSAQPQAEWGDFRALGGGQSWKSDSDRRLQFEMDIKEGGQVTIEARFFRAWIRSQTYALVQWYAWSDGGHPDLTRWFWVDRQARLSDRRIPWAAVCLLIPIEPLGDIEAVRPLAESLGQKIQISVMSVIGY
ncbi:MAG: cyanoexosortase B system-associated protein [Geitlerinemataceae cyanobacterium]